MNILASSKEKETHENASKTARAQAIDIMEQFSTLIDMVDPAVKLRSKGSKNKSSLLRDLTGMPSASMHYTTCVEQVCDDLLETADKQIDQIKNRDRKAKGLDPNAAANERRLRTENALKKP